MSQKSFIRIKQKNILDISKRYMFSLILNTWILLFFLFISLPNKGMSAENDDSSFDIQYEDQNLAIEAEDTALGTLLDEINNKCQVEIIGLEERMDETVSFSYNGKLDDGVKEFLAMLGEQDYVFEFENGLLARVILTLGDFGNVESAGPGSMVIRDENPIIVVVQNVAEGSQAQDIGMLIGDIIIDYDGVEINSAKQLKEEVEKRADKEEIKLTVLRDNETIPFVLKGGIIGVRVKTTLVSSAGTEDEGWEEEEGW